MAPIGEVAPPEDARSALVARFLETSRPSVDPLVLALTTREESPTLPARMFRVRDGRRETFVPPRSAFCLRTSVEYANPQVTLEELQGILLARLLEVTAIYLADHPNSSLNHSELKEIGAGLASPPEGRVVPFLMNVDDIEPDRYSVNPLRRSIAETRQSGRAVASVVTAGLRPDPAFVGKYRGSLVAESDLEDIEAELQAGAGGSYVDFVDRVKYAQLAWASAELGINLTIPSFRMPLATLGDESPSGPLHRMVSDCHADLSAMAAVYHLFGREITRRKTLLPAVPHSPELLASKRAVHGSLTVEGDALKGVDVHFRPTALYPNEIDHTDLASIDSEAHFTIPASRLTDYDFRETPASPQFAMYMIASPEHGAIWHGVGKYAGVQIVQSYSNFHRAFGMGEIFPEIQLPRRPSPPQWDIVAGKMLAHPAFGNIDASIACVPELSRLILEATHLRVLNVGAKDPSNPGTPTGGS